MSSITRSTVRFLLGWTPVELHVQDSNQTVLQYLRDQAQLKGTKEGCAEGDCGACTLVIGEAVNGKISYSAVNSCILFLPSLDGKQILTVETLADGGLHLIQQTMIDLHGSQCGFCTPGIMMSLLSMHLNGAAKSRIAIDDALVGNLCRCTGYGPIIDAAEIACKTPIDLEWQAQINLAEEQLIAWSNDAVALKIVTNLGSYMAPNTQDQLVEFLIDHPDATLVSGATDVGLWVTKMGKRLSSVISLSEVTELKSIRKTDTRLDIGAGVTYSDAHEALSQISYSLGELIRRIGSRQIRNRGTIGGNIANGSPIGDMPPALIAMGAKVVLFSANGKREIQLEDFFIEYSKQNLQPSEFVSRILVPRQVYTFRCYKVSKRFDQDISAVLGAFNIRIEEELVISASIAFGGMAGIPSRAALCETTLIGRTWNMETISLAQIALDKDFTPITDMRASSEYRSLAARNLLERFYLDTQNPKDPIELANRSILGGLIHE
jgi:xanthine dehydrogenase small subunit